MKKFLMYVAAVWFVNQLMPKEVAYAIVGSIVQAGDSVASWLDANQWISIAMIVAAQIIVIPLALGIAKIWISKGRF